MSVLKEKIKEIFIKYFFSRLSILVLLTVFGSGILIRQLFLLQIVDGEKYQQNFMLKVEKTKSINAPRGNIYDRKGKLLATNELVYNVTIEDSFQDSRYKNLRLNNILLKTIKLIEKYDGQVIDDFPIGIDKKKEFYFKISDVRLKRFKADVYGYTDIEYLNQEELNASARQVIDFMASSSKYGIYSKKYPKKNFGSYMPTSYDEEALESVEISEWPDKLTDEDILKIITIRFSLSANYFQRYKSVDIAVDVNERTRTAIMENKNELTGVDIAANYRRYYYDSIYFSHILGYTGQPSVDELNSLYDKDNSYSSNDEIGKVGIEKSMEEYLRGVKGEERLYVNNLGATLEYLDKKDPEVGEHVYISEDSDLTKAAYKILEQKLADILYERIINIKDYNPLSETATKIKIPINDVYFALINNNVLDMTEKEGQKVGKIEKNILKQFESYEKKVFKELKDVFNGKIKNDKSSFSSQFKEILDYSISILKQNGVIKVNDETEKKLSEWDSGKLSFNDYIHYLILNDYIDISVISKESQYFETNEISLHILSYLLDNLQRNVKFDKVLYRHLIDNGVITGKDLCLLLFDRGVLKKNKAHYEELRDGRRSPYNFIRSKIKKLELTPAMLGLDPCTGSVVIQSTETGEILALVTYPGYDLNRLSGKVDSEYYAKLTNDLSESLYNHATQQRTAPGSTYKMISSIAALEEGVIDDREKIECKGVFKEITPPPQCWRKTGHDKLDLVGAIQNSCDVYFYNVAYRLGKGKFERSDYSSEVGLKKLEKYAKMFGLGEKTGIEIPEERGHISTEDAVRSAIGQGNNSFTTLELCRYVNTIANTGQCHDLTTLYKVSDNQGNVIKKYFPKQRKKITGIRQSTWDAVKTGMREVVKDHAKIFESLDHYVHTAGKTGTAEYLKSRGNHVLFVGYAPYEKPEISIAVRIPFGYTSTYPAEVFRDIVAYYYNVSPLEEILNGSMKKSTDLISD